MCRVGGWIGKALLTSFREKRQLAPSPCFSLSLLLVFLSPPATLSDYMRNSLSDRHCLPLSLILSLCFSHVSLTDFSSYFRAVLFSCLLVIFALFFPLSMFQALFQALSSSLLLWGRRECLFLSLPIVPSSCCSGVCLQVENVQQMLGPEPRELLTLLPWQLFIAMEAIYRCRDQCLVTWSW